MSLRHLKSLERFYQQNLISRSDFLAFRGAMVTAKNEEEMVEILLKVSGTLKKAGKIPLNWKPPKYDPIQ